MELISAVLSTALGKVAAGLAVATASVGGLHATEVVDVPVLLDVGQEEEHEVEVDTGEEGLDPADNGRIGAQVAEDAKQKAGGEGDDDEEHAVEADAQHASEEGKGVDGQDVAKDARGDEGDEPGVDGMDIRTKAIEGTPAAEKAATPTPGQPEELPEAAQQGQERRAAAPVPDHAGEDVEAEAEQGVDEEDAGEPQGGPETGAEKRAAAGAGES